MHVKLNKPVYKGMNVPKFQKECWEWLFFNSRNDPDCGTSRNPSVCRSVSNESGIGLKDPREKTQNINCLTAKRDYWCPALFLPILLPRVPAKDGGFRICETRPNPSANFCERN